MIIKKPFLILRNWLNEPQKVFIFCGLFFIFSIVIKGNLYRLWNSYNELERLEQLIQKTKSEDQELDKNIALAKDPQFIERVAREKLDLVDENDLLFIFPK